jgi:hypothetical protein
VGSRALCVAGGVPPPVVSPAPSAYTAGGGSGAGTRAAGQLRRCRTLLAGGPLGGGFGDHVRLHPLSQLHGQLGVAGFGTMNRITHPVGDHGVQDLVARGPSLASQQIAGVDNSA